MVLEIKQFYFILFIDLLTKLQLISVPEACCLSNNCGTFVLSLLRISQSVWRRVRSVESKILFKIM